MVQGVAGRAAGQAGLQGVARPIGGRAARGQAQAEHAIGAGHGAAAGTDAKAVVAQRQGLAQADVAGQGAAIQLGHKAAGGEGVGVHRLAEADDEVHAVQVGAPTAVHRGAAFDGGDAGCAVVEPIALAAQHGGADRVQGQVLQALAVGQHQAQGAVGVGHGRASHTHPVLVALHQHWRANADVAGQGAAIELHRKAARAQAVGLHGFAEVDQEIDAVQIGLAAAGHAAAALHTGHLRGHGVDLQQRCYPGRAGVAQRVGVAARVDADGGGAAGHTRQRREGGGVGAPAAAEVGQAAVGQVDVALLVEPLETDRVVVAKAEGDGGGLARAHQGFVAGDGQGGRLRVKGHRGVDRGVGVARHIGAGRGVDVHAELVVHGVAGAHHQVVAQAIGVGHRGPADQAGVVQADVGLAQAEHGFAQIDDKTNQTMALADGQVVAAGQGDGGRGLVDQQVHRLAHRVARRVAAGDVELVRAVGQAGQIDTDLAAGVVELQTGLHLAGGVGDAELAQQCGADRVAGAVGQRKGAGVAGGQDAVDQGREAQRGVGGVDHQWHGAAGDAAVDRHQTGAGRVAAVGQALHHAAGQGERPVARALHLGGEGGHGGVAGVGQSHADAAPHRGVDVGVQGLRGAGAAAEGERRAVLDGVQVAVGGHLVQGDQGRGGLHRQFVLARVDLEHIAIGLDADLHVVHARAGEHAIGQGQAPAAGAGVVAEHRCCVLVNRGDGGAFAPQVGEAGAGAELGQGGRVGVVAAGCAQAAKYLFGDDAGRCGAIGRGGDQGVDVVVDAHHQQVFAAQGRIGASGRGGFLRQATQRGGQAVGVEALHGGHV